MEKYKTETILKVFFQGTLGNFTKFFIGYKIKMLKSVIRFEFTGLKATRSK